MLYIYRANVREGKLKELQQWLRKNQKKVEDSQPDSWKLAGLYFPVFGFGPRLFEIHWKLSGYAAFEEAALWCQQDKANLESGPISTLYSFLDTGSQEASLLKDATDENTMVVA